MLERYSRGKAWGDSSGGATATEGVAGVGGRQHWGALRHRQEMQGSWSHPEFMDVTCVSRMCVREVKHPVHPVGAG